MNKPEDWQLVNKETGEVKEVSALVNSACVRPVNFRAEALTQYIECGSGASSARFLSYLLTKCDPSNNYVFATFATMQKEAKVSQAIINGVMNKLYKKDLIVKVQSGVYMLSPRMLCKGGSNRGIALVKIWNDS